MPRNWGAKGPPAPPLPPVRYPPNPSPVARLGRWLFDLLTRR